MFQEFLLVLNINIYIYGSSLIAENSKVYKPQSHTKTQLWFPEYRFFSIQNNPINLNLQLQLNIHLPWPISGRCHCHPRPPHPNLFYVSTPLRYAPLLSARAYLFISDAVPCCLYRYILICVALWWMLLVSNALSWSAPLCNSWYRSVPHVLLCASLCC